MARILRRQARVSRMDTRLWTSGVRHSAPVPLPPSDSVVRAIRERKRSRRGKRPSRRPEFYLPDLLGGLHRLFERFPDLRRLRLIGLLWLLLIPQTRLAIPAAYKFAARRRDQPVGPSADVARPDDPGIQVPAALDFQGGDERQTDGEEHDVDCAHAFTTLIFHPRITGGAGD